MKFTNFEVLSILRGLDLIIESKKELLECDFLTTKDIYLNDISRIENLKEKVKDFEIDSPFFITYRELSDFQSESSLEELEEQQEEEQEKEFITLVEDKDLSSTKIIQGYAFLTSTGECLCEYIYFKEENKLEIYDLEDLNTKYFINTSINEIKSILEGIFYWGAV